MMIRVITTIHPGMVKLLTASYSVKWNCSSARRNRLVKKVIVAPPKKLRKLIAFY
jgi:hypothetical protein